MIKVSGILYDLTGNALSNAEISIYQIINSNESAKGNNAKVHTDNNGVYSFNLANGIYDCYIKSSILTDVNHAGYLVVTDESVDCKLEDILSDIPYKELITSFNIDENSVNVGLLYKVLHLIGSQIILNGGVPYTSNNPPKFSDLLEVPTLEVDWDSIENKPTEYPPFSHKHSMSDVTDFDINNYIDLEEIQSKIEISNELDISTKIPTCNAVYEHLHNKYDINGNLVKKGVITKIYDIINNIDNIQPIENSEKYITSGAVYNAIQNFQYSLDSMPESGEVNTSKWDVSTVDKVKTYRKTITLSAPSDEYYFSGNLGFTPDEVLSYEIKINGTRFAYGVSLFYVATGGCSGGASTVHYWSKTEGSMKWGIILNPGSTVYIEYIVTRSVEGMPKDDFMSGKGSSVSFVSKHLYQKNAPLVQTTPATPTPFDDETIPRY
jgi:hypothetical protein